MVRLLRRARGEAPSTTTVEEPSRTDDAGGPSTWQPEGADRYFARAQHPHASVEFRGKFEGLWTDRADALEIVARRRRAGQLDDDDAQRFVHWIEHGYVILPGAVSNAECDAVGSDLRRAFEHGDERLHVFAPGEQSGSPLTAGLEMDGMRVNDIYVYFDSAREALFNDAVLSFLSIAFDAAPLLIQSLTFEHGSQQGFHQDTAYVVIDPPLALAATWLALEDVKEGSGELMYLDGSHRLADHLFSSAYKSWHLPRDGFAGHDHYCAGLIERSAAANLEERRLLARKGDVLIWSADLAHGGSPVVHAELDQAIAGRALLSGMGGTQVLRPTSGSEGPCPVSRCVLRKHALPGDVVTADCSDKRHHVPTSPRLKWRRHSSS